MKDIRNAMPILMLAAIAVGFTGTLDYRHDLNLERERHARLKERTATYAEALAACANEVGFTLADAIVLCQRIAVPKPLKRGVQL